MSEEERNIEIINNLKKYFQNNIDKGYSKFVYNDYDLDEKNIDILNALDYFLENNTKQQEEIEELKYKYKKYGKVLFTEDAIKENYVSKNEIREKIKTFKNIPNYGIFDSKEPIIRVLKELLGE